MDYFKMKKSDFKKLPLYDEMEDKPKEFSSLIIIPTNRKHDSGWKVMDYVITVGGEATCRIESGSDVIHLDGIGGGGPEYGKWPTKRPASWCIDCLPCGYLRLFARDSLSLDEFFGSDFEVYCKNEYEEKTVNLGLQEIQRLIRETQRLRKENKQLRESLDRVYQAADQIYQAVADPVKSYQNVADREDE